MAEGTDNGRFVILVVEDDAAVRNLLTMTLDLQGYRVEYADRGSAGLMAAASLNPDLLILDLGLPDMDGSGVIGKIRSWSDVPILVVSARLEDADKVAALDAGADDYIVKPFSVDELLARPPLHDDAGQHAYHQAKANQASQAGEGVEKKVVQCSEVHVRPTVSIERAERTLAHSARYVNACRVYYVRSIPAHPK